MKAKNVLVSFLAIAAVLFLAGAVNAQIVKDNWPANYYVTVNDVAVWDSVYGSENVAVEAGEEITVEVRFESGVYASDVRVRAELEGDKVDVKAVSAPFDVETNSDYIKRLRLKVPYELEDELSTDLTLSIKVWNGDYKFEDEFELRVQRPTYKADIKLISTPQTISAGETFPVEIAIENIGYNNLDDVYVIARIPELGVEQATYFSDIVALECDDDEDSTYNYGAPVDRKCNEDDEDTAFGRMNLRIPYEAESGVYTLEVEVINDDTSTVRSRPISVENEFSGGSVIATTSRKTVSVGEEAEFSLVLVNPTDKVKVYRIVSGTSGDLSSSVSESVVAIPAGSSKTVTITAEADSAGEHNFDVSIFAGEKLTETVTLTLNAEGTEVTSPIVILTIVLAIIFIVLLVVLIVLIGRKPEKSEEFGESYY